MIAPHFLMHSNKEVATLNNVALNLAHAEVRVNVLVCQLIDKKGKKTQFSWVTDIELNHKNLEEIMLIGRSRWKIENETGRHSATDMVKSIFQP